MLIKLKLIKLHEEEDDQISVDSQWQNTGRNKFGDGNDEINL